MKKKMARWRSRVIEVIAGRQEAVIRKYRWDKRFVDAVTKTNRMRKVFIFQK